jgi:D-lyxose ketol-isomerase
MGSKDEKMSRRRVIKTTAVAAAVGGAMSLTGCNETSPKDTGNVASINLSNEYYYDADGKFSEDKAKDAYIALMTYHGYPVFEGVKEKLWVSDYGTGQFAKLGLGCNMFQNNEKDQYMLMDFFLMSGQMLPEHYHLKTENNPAKMEGWLCRHGLSYVYGEGEPTKPMKAVVPKCHMDGTVTVSNETVLKPGMFAPLNNVNAPHWQFGGPEGAIITEVATVHDNDGVRHSDTNLKFP